MGDKPERMFITGRKPDIETVIARAVRYHEQGVSREMIAQRMGVQVGTVSGYLSRARHRGMLKAHPRPTNEFTALLLGLPKPVTDWLLAQVPPGGTMTDLLRAIIADAYTDEMNPDPEL